MGHRYSQCGRFVKRLMTNSPPDRYCFGSVPYAPFVCNNHGVEYQQVNSALTCIQFETLYSKGGK